MTAERTPKSDKDLWQSLALDHGLPPAAVSDLDFAAWLEGRLPEAEMARIDAAVAHDPELRAAAFELADILREPLPAAPPRMAVRAQALVGFAAERSFGQRSRAGTWLAALLPSFENGFSLQRSVMAGLAVVVAAAGFVMGGGLGKSFVERRYASTETPTTFARPFGTDTSHQLNDLFADNI